MLFGVGVVYGVMPDTERVAISKEIHGATKKKFGHNVFTMALQACGTMFFSPRVEVLLLKYKPTKEA